VVEASNLTQAKTLLGEYQFALCLTDMRMPDGDGIDLVKHIQVQCPHIPVAVITAYGNVEGAVNSLKAGAYDYVSKPVDLQILRNLVNRALKLSSNNNSEKDGGVVGDINSDSTLDLLGRSGPMVELRSKISKLARSQAPILIHGASGTGKELVARLIHDQGPRADKSFVPVNCGAIPKELMESEFFGHKKGSFTGAVTDKLGLFQAADGGTLFLDEIAELPIDMQVKLLRAIQERAVRPIGSQQEQSIDTRILSATHNDLSELVKNGEFRQDLYYRINVIELKVPSLSERAEDIPMLAQHFIEKLMTEGRDAGGQGVETGAGAPVLSNEAKAGLQEYLFPGNVRELENILERALTLCDGKMIALEDLHLPADSHAAVDNPQSAQTQSLKTSTSREVLTGDVSLETYLDNIEKDMILDALEKHRWNKTQAAKSLGISFRALRYRLEKLGL